MSNVNSINRVLEIFGEISSIPRGSGNMNEISNYCVNFAQKLGLRVVCDEAKNVIIYKDASKGKEDANVIILQGHLDMVCQKSDTSNIDFYNDGITVMNDGSFLRADGTTLGADNGIAVAMALAILERNDLVHPPLEIVFTTDEEIGMVGAKQLDTSLLKGKKLINIDSEEDETVTVSCAGGSDFRAQFGIKRETKNLTGVKVVLKGLKGGHSGVEIGSHRQNAAVLAGRLLQNLLKKTEVSIISITSGDKANAIPNQCVLELGTKNAEQLISLIEDYIEVIKTEISHSEGDFLAEITQLDKKKYKVLKKSCAEKLVFALCLVPNGVIEMSSEIEGLVETSLNLGILSLSQEKVTMQFALRSNKSSALSYLEERLMIFFTNLKADITVGGYYPPWEYKKDSALRDIYVKTYAEIFGKPPKVEAIHAGLECAVFSSSIEGADCIAIGPNVFDAHTVNECLEIKSAQKIYNCLIKTLEQL